MRYLKKMPFVLTFAGPGLRRTFSRKVAGLEDLNRQAIIATPVIIGDVSHEDSQMTTLPVTSRDRSGAQNPHCIDTESSNKRKAFSEAEGIPNTKIRKTSAQLSLNQMMEACDNVSRFLTRIVKENHALKVTNRKLMKKCEAQEKFLEDLVREHHDSLFVSKFGGKMGVTEYTIRFRSSKLDPNGEHLQCIKEFEHSRGYVQKKVIQNWLSKHRRENADHSDEGAGATR